MHLGRPNLVYRAADRDRDADHARRTDGPQTDRSETRHPVLESKGSAIEAVVRRDGDLPVAPPGMLTGGP